MTTADGRDLEPGFIAGTRLAWRTLRVGISRPIVTSVGAVLFVLAAAGASALVPPEYAPSYVVRVTETDREPGTIPQPKRELREYVESAVFTSAPLFGVMKAHNLYPGLMRKDPRGALQSFREDIEVEVYRNYFVEERAVTDRPRTARIAVSYRSKDPELALVVTRELGALIIEREKKALHDQAARSAGFASESVERLKGALAERRQSLFAKQSEIRREPRFDARREVELVSLSGSVDSLERSLSTAERRKATLDFVAELERTGAGVRFEVVDDGALPRKSRFSLRDAPSLVGFGLVFGLPLVALAVGAFSFKRGLA